MYNLHVSSYLQCEKSAFMSAILILSADEYSWIQLYLRVYLKWQTVGFQKLLRKYFKWLQSTVDYAYLDLWCWVCFSFFNRNTNLKFLLVFVSQKQTHKDKLFGLRWQTSSSTNLTPKFDGISDRVAGGSTIRMWSSWSEAGQTSLVSSTNWRSICCISVIKPRRKIQHELN